MYSTNMPIKMPNQNNHLNAIELKHIETIAAIAIKSSARLKNFLRRWEKDEVEIEEIISKSILCATQNIHSYKGESTIEAWFFGICKNTAKQHVTLSVYRKKWRVDVDNYNELVELIIDANAMPLDDFLHIKNLLHKVLRLASSFSEDQRNIFESIYINGNSYDVAAQQLCIKVGTLKSRVNRMRLRIAKEIDY